MAATYRSYASNVTDATAGTTGITIDKPTGVANGDTLIACVGWADELGTWTNAQGFSLASGSGTNPEASSAGNDRNVAVFYKHITNAAGEPSTYTFTNGSGSSFKMAGFIVAVQNTDPTDPIDELTSNSSANDFTPAAPNITTGSDGCCVLLFHMAALGTGVGKTGGAPTSPVSFNLLNYRESTSGTAIGMEAAYYNWGAAEAITIGSWTGTPDDSASEFVVFSVAVRAAAASVTGGTIASTAALHVPTLAYRAATAFLASTLSLFAPTVKPPPQAVTGAFIGAAGTAVYTHTAAPAYQVLGWGAATATWNSVNIGSASADRIVVVHVGWNFVDRVLAGTSPVTINGTDANIAIEGDNSAIAYLNVPSGTTANITVNWDANLNLVGIHVGTITGAGASATPYATGERAHVGGLAGPFALDSTIVIPTDGVGIANTSADGSLTNWEYTEGTTHAYTDTTSGNGNSTTTGSKSGADATWDAEIDDVVAGSADYGFVSMTAVTWAPAAGGGGATLYAPSSVEHVVVSGTIASTAALYEPTVVPQAVGITGGTVASTVALYEPTVALTGGEAQAVTGAFIGAGTPVVATIHSDWGSEVDSGYTKYHHDGGDWVGDYDSNPFRIGNKFLFDGSGEHGGDSVPTNAIVTKVEAYFHSNKDSFCPTSMLLGPYNGDGSGDFETDTGATMWGRLDISADYYAETAVWSGASGGFWITLGDGESADACVDVTNRLSAGSFNLAFISGQEGETAWNYDDFWECDDGPTNNPKLRVTYYIPGGGATLYAPSAVEHVIASGTVASTLTLYAPTVVPELAVTGGTVASTTVLYAASIEAEGYEKFDTYTEVDTSGDYTVSRYRVDIDSIEASEYDSCVHKDFGADYFGDFVIEFESRVTSGAAGALFCPLILSNTPAPVYDDVAYPASDGIVVQWYFDSGTLWLWFEGKSGQSQGTDACSVGTTYYFRVTRTASSVLKCEIFTDPGRTSLLNTRTLTYEGTTYRYLSVAAAGYPNDNTYMSGHVANLSIEAGAQAQAVTGATISSGATLYAPSVSLEVTGGTIGSTLALYVPTVAHALTGASIGSTAALYAPTATRVSLVDDVSLEVIAAGEVTGAHIPSTATLYAPTVVAGQEVTSGTVASTTNLYAPTVVPQAVAVTAGHVASTATLSAPTVAPGAVTVVGGTVASGTALYAPTVTPGAVSTVGAHVPSTAVLGPPTVAAGAVEVTAGTITTTLALYEPTVAVGGITITTGTVASGSTLSPPSVSVGPVSTVGAHVASTLSLYAPSLALTVSTGTVASTAALYAPGPVVGLNSITLPTIPGRNLDEGEYGLSFTSSYGAHEHAQSFQFAVSVVIWQVKARLRKFGSPATVVARIYNHTGTFGSGGKPTGAALAESDPVSVGTGTFDVTLTFSGVPLAAGTYCVSIADDGATDGDYVGDYVPLVPMDGNHATYAGGTWTADAFDIRLNLYGPGGSVLYSPTLTVGAVDVTAGTITSTLSLFAPDIALEGAVIGGTVTSTAALYAPTVIVEQPVVAGTIASGAALYPPTVTLLSQEVTAGTIAAGSTLYAASLAYVVETGTVASTTALYSGTVAGAVTSAHIPAGSALYAPSLGMVVVAAHVPSTIALYAPTVTAGVLPVTGGHIQSTAATYPPTVAVGAVGITAGTVASTLQLYASAVGTGVAGGTVAPTSALYPPTVVAELSVTSGTIAAGTALYAPSLAYTVQTGTISSTVSIYEPTVSVGAAPVTAGTIASGTTLYPPTVSAFATVTTGTVGATTTLYPPTVTPGATGVVSAYISAASTLYAPSVSHRLAGGTIASTLALYAPTVAPGIVEVTGGTIASGTVLYGPNVAASQDVVGAFIPSGTTLYSATIGYGSTGAFIIVFIS